MDSAHCREFWESCFLYHNSGCKLIASLFNGGSESSGNWTWRYLQHFRINTCTSSELAHAKGSHMWLPQTLVRCKRTRKDRSYLAQLLVQGISVNSQAKYIRSKLTSCPNHCRLTSGKHSLIHILYSFIPSAILPLALYSKGAVQTLTESFKLPNINIWLWQCTPALGWMPFSLSSFHSYYLISHPLLILEYSRNFFNWDVLLKESSRFEVKMSTPNLFTSIHLPLFLFFWICHVPVKEGTETSTQQQHMPERYYSSSSHCSYNHALF